MNLEPQANTDQQTDGQPSGEHAAPVRGENRRGPLKFAYASGSRPLEGYTIKRGIGAGGFGDVYYATSDAGKDVALKRIQRNLDVELRGVSQCLNLKHPNLVDLYDIRYDDQAQAWVVMEYVSGASLQDEIARNPNGMPEDQVHSWMQGIIAGVSYLHDHGIVHRDLKPGNIFLDHQTVKIGDYGLSKFISCSRRSGQTESVGTFHYMAPEIGLGRYGKEIDIYALGILLFEMLTGRVPFEGESSQEIIMKHLTAQPDLSRVPKKYRSIISRAMAKDPQHRFRSAEEIMAAVNGTAGQNGSVGSVPPLRPAASFEAGAQPAFTGQAFGGLGGNGLGGNGLGGRAASAPGRSGPAGQVPPDVKAFRYKTYEAAHRAHQWAQAPQEPLASAVRRGLHSLRDRWTMLPGIAKVFIAVVMTVFGIATLPWIFATTFFGLIIYGVYYMLWYVLFRVVEGPAHPSTQAYRYPSNGHDAVPRGLMDTAAHGSPINNQVSPSVDHAPPILPKTPTLPAGEAVAKTPADAREQRRNGEKARKAKLRPKFPSQQQIDDKLRDAMQRKTFAQRGAELTGSMLMAAFVAGVLSLFMAMLDIRDPASIHVSDWAPLFVWLSTTSIVGAWLVLGLAKVWESNEGDQALRRFCTMISGMAVGGIAFLLFQGLSLEPNYVLADWHELNDSLVAEGMPALYGADGTPHPLAFAGYFGGLFLVLRWWMAADPIRRSRLGFWGTVVTVFVAMIAYAVVPVPRGFMVVAAISIAVQLSAPWVNHRRRRQVKERLMSASST